jgi:hypothetical protein
MASSDVGVPVRFVLDSLRQRVEDTSLRSVAGEVGLSPNGLRGILNGAPPRPSNLRKLVDWYAQLPEPVLRPTREVTAAALAILLSELPPASRPTAEKEVRSLLCQHFGSLGVSIPKWLGP